VQTLIFDLKADPKGFWNKMGANKEQLPTPADPAECRDFFFGVFNKGGHNSEPAILQGDTTADCADATYNAAITEADVGQVLRRLKNGKAAGSDGIPVEFYKYAVIRDDKGRIQRFLLAPVLAAVFNACFQHGVVPQDWGKALLTLIHKGGDDTDWGRYRPIAVVCHGA
jgi:hypothetical protein